MHLSIHLVVVVSLATFSLPCPAQSKKQPALSPKILSAKSVHFENKTGDAAVGDEALKQLKKWGRFQIVEEPKEADLILVLSAGSPKGDQILYSGGQTGSVGISGGIDRDPVPNYGKAAPVRYAFLSVIDPKTGEKLWSDSRVWGGLLTGFNSAGARLIKKLKKEIEK